MMDTLFIDRKDSTLTVESKHLVIRHPAQRQLITAPLAQLRSVIVAAEVVMNSKLLWQLSAHQVNLVVLHPREAKFSAQLFANGQHGNIQRRLGQYRLSQQLPQNTLLANRLVASRLLGMSRLLQQALIKRPDLRLPLLLASTRQRKQRQQLLHEPLSIPSLLGVEGSATAGYFDVWGQLLPRELAFSGRKRRPPPDPVNVALSLGFTLLTNELSKQLVAKGLEPMLGFYHQPSYGRDSLACDVCEIFRHRVEGWVWRLFAEQTLTLEHFGQQEPACILNKTGRAVFYREWYKFRSKQLSSMRRIVRLFVRYIEHREALFERDSHE
ncbi:CRISPR-associated endonuclease Cas1 [Oceanisphaera profunda]|uniref:CRISPR-associated endonuclease Cas1 n=1 Tax=Oceanisphaera profunda TaxID=1416627 RepID=A0A1Y0D7B5_9GAMM|nr:CRISPR-associated endonuclease Cas1 [Oceanisphaera profunda]ART83441.1 CRISPR-associated endonuclease Cas1 [Oceanisphaera profunda]